MSSESTFINSYGALVARTWSDPAFLQQLLDDPCGTVNDAGLKTKEKAVVRVIQVKETTFGKAEDQVSEWAEGDKTGIYTLWIPIKPDDLDADAHGMMADSSCCCTPCCCCT